MNHSQPTQLTPERIMKMAFGYAPPLILEAAIAHKMFDLLDEGPKSAEEVSQASGASLRGVRMILNALVGLEFLKKDGQGRYTLTPESQTFLVSTKPGYRGAFFRHISGQLLPKWLELTRVVASGKPAGAVNVEGPGTEFFADFVESIFPMSHPAALALAETLGLADAQQPVRMLDLAAGSGVWGITLAQKSPQVQVTAVDWPGVIEVTRRVAERMGVGDRFNYVSGDLRSADFGQGHHVATLGHILHSEGEQHSRGLIKKTYEALAPGGTIAVAEWLVNDDRTGPPEGLLFAVNMLVNTDEGDTFSFDEIRAWLEEAGFKNARTLQSPGPSPLIVADKPA